MDRNIRIARQLVRIARMLVADADSEIAEWSMAKQQEADSKFGENVVLFSVRDCGDGRKSMDVGINMGFSGSQPKTSNKFQNAIEYMNAMMDFMGDSMREFNEKFPKEQYPNYILNYKKR